MTGERLPVQEPARSIPRESAGTGLRPQNADPVQPMLGLWIEAENSPFERRLLAVTGDREVNAIG